MKIIIGLGNPGKKYEKTRHNAGFRVIDVLEKRLVADSQSPKAILFKPQGFMNLSGQEVVKKLQYYKTKPQDLIVIYDDLDLLLGQIRIRNKGRSAGHKGMQSIIDSLGTEEIARVRIGIGRPNEKMPAETYVLQNFSDDEEKIILKTIDEAAEKVLELIKHKA